MELCAVQVRVVHGVLRLDHDRGEFIKHLASDRVVTTNKVVRGAGVGV